MTHYEIASFTLTAGKDSDQSVGSLREVRKCLGNVIDHWGIGLVTVTDEHSELYRKHGNENIARLTMTVVLFEGEVYLTPHGRQGRFILTENNGTLFLDDQS